MVGFRWGMGTCSFWPGDKDRYTPISRGCPPRRQTAASSKVGPEISPGVPERHAGTGGGKRVYSVHRSGWHNRFGVFDPARSCAHCHCKESAGCGAGGQSTQGACHAAIDGGGDSSAFAISDRLDAGPALLGAR